MATAIKLKQINVEKVRSELKSLETYTKNSLSEATALSIATCGNIIKEMIDAGEVVEIELAESTGGRPSRQFKYNTDFSYVLTIYLRKEKDCKSIYYAVSNIVGETIHDELNEYAQINISVVDSIIEKIYSEFTNIKVIAFGIPGVVRNGQIDICDYKSFINLNIISHYESKYDIKVSAINDVNCTALGYHCRMQLDSKESLVYIYYPLNCGPGAGIIINGKVLNGTTNFAGEVSYLPHYILSEKADESSGRDALYEQGVLRTIMSVNCLINPKTIVLSGMQFKSETISNIRKLAGKHILDAHIPEIECEKDIHESYINGLTAIALEQLTYKFII